MGSASILQYISTHRAIVESTRKAHIIPPMDSADVFGDPPSTGIIDPVGVLLLTLLPAVGDNHEPVPFGAIPQLVLGVKEAAYVEEGVDDDKDVDVEIAVDVGESVDVGEGVDVGVVEVEASAL